MAFSFPILRGFFRPSSCLWGDLPPLIPPTLFFFHQYICFLLFSRLTLFGRAGRPKGGGGKRLNASLPEPGPDILVFDDDELIRQQIERLYIRSGYAVSPVATAEDALERLETGDIDLVVTDIQLPGLSGVELTEPKVAVIPAGPYVFLQLGRASGE